MKVNAHFYPEIALFSTKTIYAHAKITIRDFFFFLNWEAIRTHPLGIQDISHETYKHRKKIVPSWRPANIDSYRNKYRLPMFFALFLATVFRSSLNF